jgi:subtilisin family serine protease
MALRSRTRPTTAASSTLLAVTYSSVTAQRSATSIARNESAVGAILVRSLTFSHTNKVMHVVSTGSVSKLVGVEAALKALPGVVSVAPTGMLRRPTTVTHPYWTNDPYFNGFTAAQNAEIDPLLTPPLPDQPSTYQVTPYVESANVPGQWDMHAIGLGNAFEYSVAGNGSGLAPNAGALGLASVKIAVIDTGEDPNHPELPASKIVYQKCFITNAAQTAQSTSDFETDPDGHGTDVSGIAAADTNNDFGFTGTGGGVVLDAYRVYPTPDDDCETDTNPNDPQCGANTLDIASAIDDAITQGANVITMSLGGGSCTAGGPNGGDDDPIEGAAVEEAITANVVVVAAAGNSGGPPTEAPGCDAGVLAVGATSLDDGQPDMSGHTGGTAATPVEYVATYTDYGTTDTPNSPASWGIVAPGGDPLSDLDNDELHWIENIWTTTPYTSAEGDLTYTGNCVSDYPETGTVIDCRTLIAGTSMATPHVAGAAALILSATGGSTSIYQSPTAMRTLLCGTADNINDPNQGCGRLNVYRAMAVALHDPTPP